MSSTVTSTTVATMTSAVTLAEVAATLTLLAIVLLAATVITKEVSTGTGLMARRFARGIDLALAPMLVIFASIVAMGFLNP